MKLFNLSMVILFSFILPAVAYSSDSELITGSWCFYEQTADGNTVSEKVDITFNDDNTYVWKEGFFEQKGTWKIENNKLIMTNVGTHKIISINATDMELKRYSVMRFRKNRCDTNSFAAQDITQFHNAASTGEADILQDFIKRGIDINITDLSRGDTALIKAAKFCRIAMAKILLENGADKNIKNQKGKTPLDLAKNSSFHEGCDELVRILQ